MLYILVKYFWLAVISFRQPIRLFGRENIPRKGAFLFVANHLSSNDPFLLAAGTRRHLAFMGKASLFRHPVAGFIMRGLNAFPVDRDADPRAVLEKTVEILRGGRPTTMFPEGSRNKVDTSLREFKKGAALVAVKAGVPVLPAAILGTRNKEEPITVLYGKPIFPPENTREGIRGFNEEMHQAVQSCLEELRPLHARRLEARKGRKKD